MKALLIGASGTIGKAVDYLLTKQGFTLIGASRSTQPSVDFTSLASIDAFYEQIGELDAILLIGGDAAFAPLDQLTDSQIELTLASKLMGQINMARRGIARLRPNGVLVMTGGMLAYAPWPATSMVAMVNAGLEGFVRAAALDMTLGRRLVIVHPPLVAETAGLFGLDGTSYPTAATVAQSYLEAVESGRNGTAVFVSGYAPASDSGLSNKNADDQDSRDFSLTNYTI
ncbi:short chain dehydrogenase [Fibrisoma montanum]|uniref:Short chain dehydrogenase n=1 Tax=Fibrisoma montanum TaxID=2305895 RepID=A0A418LWI2_9BACT|nr:short chain dehydrogenase [Fibrisoma montanum]RIV17568.1 short chain dehydrogenase [Fibrisoma montanum]